MKRSIIVFLSILFVFTYNLSFVYGNVTHQEPKQDSLAHLWKTREIKINGKIGITDIATPATEIPQFLSLAGLPHPCNDSIPEDISTQKFIQGFSVQRRFNLGAASLSAMAAKYRSPFKG